MALSILNSGKFKYKGWILLSEGTLLEQIQQHCMIYV